MKEQDDTNLNILKISNDKKLLYEFLDSYPKTSKNDSEKNQTINNKNNSIETLINFMHFMNSKDKNKSNKKENEIKNNSFNDNENKEIMSDSLNEENNKKENESSELHYDDNNNNSENNSINDIKSKNIPSEENVDIDKISSLNDINQNITDTDINKNNDSPNKMIQKINHKKQLENKKKKKTDNLFSNISNIKNNTIDENKLFQNHQYQAVIDEANQILQNKYKKKNNNNNNIDNIILPDVLYPEIIMNKIINNDKKADEETYKEKIYELNKERVKKKNENEKIKKLKINYDNLYTKLQNEIKKFNLNNQKKLENFNKYKNDEKDKIEKEKKQLILEQKEIGELRIKYQMNTKLNNKKDKEDIIQLKKRFQKFYEENKIKENNNKILIEKYKRQLDEANYQILKLNGEITKLQTLQNNDEEEINHNIDKRKEKDKDSPKFVSKKGNNNKLKNEIIDGAEKINNDENNIIEDESEENYDLIFPEKYHKQKYKLINSAKTEDGKKINFYDKNKKEIIFQSGVRKEIYFDGYQIIYFTNGDIKQIFPEKTKQVYFFNESKIIQTTIPDKIQVFKFENGQIEKHYINGIKEIIFPNGNIKKIYQDGTEENLYNDDNENNDEEIEYEDE
jgi:centromere protein J